MAGLLSADDVTQMMSDLNAVREDNEVSVVFRRGAATLAAQDVRVARMGGQGREMESATSRTQQSEGKVVVMGYTTLDVQPQDRFTIDGDLYEVIVVRPNRTAAVMAEARLVE